MPTGHPLLPLERLDAIDRLVDDSQTRPVLILKHSRTCGRSVRAYEEVVDWLASPRGTAATYLVDVHQSRAISDAVAQRFGIRHESPQMLLLYQGRVRWSASHEGVTSSAIDAALQADGLH